MQKLAATRNLAVVVLSQCATRMQAGSGERGAAASLIPAVNASAWEEGVSTRVVLFRDWSMQDGTATAARFAAALKINGKRVEDEDVRLAAFDIGTVRCQPDLARILAPFFILVARFIFFISIMLTRRTAFGTLLVYRQG